MILDDMGFTEMITEIRKRIICVFSTAVFEKFGGDFLDKHHSFIVSYKIGEDEDLGFHVDDSEVFF